HDLGQSWGGFLAQEFALTQPEGLKALVLADTAASFPDFVVECSKLRAGLPPEVEAILRKNEEAGTTAHPEYAQACEGFYKPHLCRIDPMPADVTRSFGWIDE